jgi:hypothetical protein
MATNAQAAAYAKRIAYLEARLRELEAALRDIGNDCETLAHDASDVGERRAWKAVGTIARAALRDTAPAGPPLPLGHPFISGLSTCPSGLTARQCHHVVERRECGLPENAHVSEPPREKKP